MTWEKKTFDNTDAVATFLDTLTINQASVAKVITVVPKKLPHPGYHHSVSYDVLYPPTSVFP